MKFFYAFLIILVGTIIYANSLHNPFIFDDEFFIVRNPYIHHFSNFKAIVDYLPRRWVGTWTFALNYALGGFNVWGYHAFNILIHISCGLVVWWFFCLILSAPKFRSLPIAAEKEKLALWAALIFITHPVQTMAVDHITQRYASLAALFYLTTLSLYFKGRLSQEKTRWWFFIASAITGYLGIFTREAVVTLPLAIILCEILILGNPKETKTNSKKYWLLTGLIVFITGIVSFFYHFNIIELLTKTQLVSQSHQGETITAFTYFLTEFRVILIYVRLLFWPVGLNFDYDMPLSYSFREPDVLVSCLFIILLLTYAARVKSRYPLVSFGIFWFFLTLSVESTIFPLSYMITEYRLYLPLFGICISFVYVMRTLIQNKKVFTALITTMVLILSLLTIQRNTVYKSEVSLWTDTIKKSPFKSRPYTNLGAAYSRLKEYPQAIKYLRRAIELEPDNYDALTDLADVYAINRVFDKAIAINEQLLQRKPSAPVYSNLGLIYYTMGDLNKAQEYFNKARSINRYYQEACFNLATLFIHKGQLKQAKEIYLDMLFEYPQENKARYALLMLDLNSGQASQADAMAKGILASGNNDPHQLVNLGSILASRGHLDMALNSYTKALSMDYTCTEAYIEMGKLFYNQHQVNDAIRVWQTGLKYASHTETLNNLIDQARIVQKSLADVSR